MFKRIATLLAIGFCFTTVNALACDGPQCVDLWADGGVDQNQVQTINFMPVAGGGIIYNDGFQDQSMWAGTGGFGDGTAEIEVLASQAESLEMTQPILGGNLFAEHQAIQEGRIFLDDVRAGGWADAQNFIAGSVEANGNVFGSDTSMDSHNTNYLNSTASLCVFNGTGSLRSEVLNQNGHTQNLSFAGGTGMTTSYTGIHSTLDMSVTD